MVQKAIVFLYMITLFKATQSQLNYGPDPYNYFLNQNCRHSSNTPINTQHHSPLHQSTPESNVLNIWSSPPKCSPPTAVAYYLPGPPVSPKVTVLNTKSMDNKIKPIIDNFGESMHPPTYPCPFCTGKLNVPPKVGIPPPPLSYPVLPGIIDTIPSIIPLVDNIDDCKCSNRKTTILEDIIDTSSLLPNTFNYDKELLEGFLTSLGL